MPGHVQLLPINGVQVSLGVSGINIHWYAMSSAPVEEVRVWSDWTSFPDAPAQMRATNCSLDDLCHLQYTAGTTGQPKGAMLTHGNWITALDAECEALRITPDDVYLGIYPMGHVGLSWGLAVLRAGGTYVMMERFDLEHYLALASRYKVTILAGMPPVIHSLIHSPPGTEQQLARCPRDHFRWRATPAGDMGDVRSAISISRSRTRTGFQKR